MRRYERNGITIDQCSECRGIFLDRGELERLMDAEAAYDSAHAASVAPPPSPRSATPVYGSPNSITPEPGPDHRLQRYDSDRGHQPQRYDSDRNRYGSDGYYRKTKKRSFLEDIVD